MALTEQNTIAPAPPRTEVAGFPDGYDGPLATASLTLESAATGDGLFDVKQSIQDELLKRVNRHKSSFEGLADGEFRAKVREIVVAILSEPGTAIPPGWTAESLLTELLHDFLGLGPLEK